MNLLKALILLPTVLSLECPAKPGPFQIQPQSYRGTEKASRSAFERTVNSNQNTANGYIPSVCDEAVRVATFNVHYHKCLYDKNDNTGAIQDDLVKLSPSIVIFQEVVTKKGPARNNFENMLQSLGYNSREFISSRNAFLGNMIASKVPMTKLKELYMGNTRVVVAASVNVDGNKVAILGTHLDHQKPDIREQQAKMIMEYIGKEIAPNFDQYILAGDMNAHWNSNEIQTFVAGGNLVESFAAIGAPVPNYTCWAGTTIDFIFVSKALSGKLLGSYAYQTVSSDHLPVLVDLRLSKGNTNGSGPNPQPNNPPQPDKSDAAKETGLGWKTWIIIVLLILVIVMAAVAAYVYFRQRSEL